MHSTDRFAPSIKPRQKYWKRPPNRDILSAKMPSQPPARIAEIVSDFRRMYARVALKLRVSASLVSKVANGDRDSPEIDKALRQELKVFKEKLAKHL